MIMRNAMPLFESSELASLTVQCEELLRKFKGAALTPRRVFVASSGSASCEPSRCGLRYSSGSEGASE
uniref:Uncharacterized protein n=1 Tax=Rhizobium leguminosarum TaxID=384 RepID=A0A179BHT9_RHILE|nr:hypothetical protein A4U53_27815 [Rhizobium leguminosarum]